MTKSRLVKGNGRSTTVRPMHPLFGNFSNTSTTEIAKEITQLQFQRKETLVVSLVGALNDASISRFISLF